MSKMTLSYEGDLQLKAVHELSGTEIMTDAPPDNQGKGRSFSPTDLASTALGACMATIIGIVARRDNIDLTGMTLSVEKIMTSDPVRRIGELKVNFEMPAGIPEAEQKKLIRAAETCPVHKSLHPDIKITVNYDWS